ncbi:hypothetical protein [Synechococcus sp. CS-205]|uniref:hypothetical protein n=1 Tax=Synechococcus sp. CS-205 TaxID=2847984 RepID=UPI00223AF374|nr:hypothetical protein [Synechococcus sp. CS-205]MCT0248170.1 hypothetical protein [Synechococcus sp. CS-205]
MLFKITFSRAVPRFPGITFNAILGTSAFLMLTSHAQALTYSFTPSSITVPSGDNKGGFAETISFGSFSFDFTAPSTISAPVSGTASSTVRVVNYTFNNATYDPGLQLLTFTGPGPTSPDPDFSTSSFVLQLDAPLDSVTPPNFPTYKTISFGDYCTRWQDQGNTKCRSVGSATLNPIQPIPFGHSGLGLAPLLPLAWYRRRLMRRLPKLQPAT